MIQKLIELFPAPVCVFAVNKIEHFLFLTKRKHLLPIIPHFHIYR